MCNNKAEKNKCENRTEKKNEKQFSIWVFGFCSIIVGNLNL